MVLILKERFGDVMIILGKITQLSRDKKQKEQNKPRYISQEQIRRQGTMLVLSVLNEDGVDILDKEFSFEMKDRILPLNVRKNHIVRCEAELQNLNQKKKMLVIKKMLIEPPASTLKELYNRTGIDVFRERNNLAAAEHAEISLNKHFQNGGAESNLAKKLYNQEISALCQLMESCGIAYDVEVADKIKYFFERRAKVRKYNNVYEMVSDNPYVLTDLEEFPMNTIIKAAPIINRNVADKVIIYSHLTSLVWFFTRQGHSYAPLNLVSFILKQVLLEKGIPEDQHRYYLMNLAAFKEEELPHRSVSKIVSFGQFDQEAYDYYLDVYQGESEKPEQKARNARKGFYLVSAFHAERNAAKKLAQYIMEHRFKKLDIPKNMSDLDPQQAEAVRNALTNRLSIINGHAGSGKTYVVAKLVQILKENGLRAVVLAPSAIAAAHAAAKVAEKTNLPAEHGTIHRIAKILSSDDDYGEDKNQKDNVLINKGEVINEDVVIVDEMSMCDICTFDHLLHAMEGNPHTHLVLVGDTAQLPAIGPSGFFHQLVRIGRNLDIPVVSLTEQHRNDDEIFVFADMIRRGNFPDELEGQFTKIKIGSIRDVHNVAVQLRDQGVDIKDILFLSPVSFDERCGTKKLNRILREVYNPQGTPIEGTPFCVGDPVIAIKNDYADKDGTSTKLYIAKKRHPERKRDIYNGLRGMIINYKEDTVTVEFPDPDKPGQKFKTFYKPEELQSWLDAAYALTVHKAQGQEAKYVVLVNESKRLTRNMLYTAVTRAKQGVYLLGKEEIFRQAAGKPNDEPLSKFIFRLQDLLNASQNATIENKEDGFEVVFEG